MIQRATDPTASRTGWRHAEAEARDPAPDHQRPRGGHAWPFISRQAERTARPPQTPRPQTSDCGS